jgi:hypothetical protein
MPHDAKGRELHRGDIVMVPFKVRSVSATENHCNLELETVATMPPEHTYKPNMSAMNTRMALRANPGDDISYTVVVGTDGIETRLA